MANKFFSEQKEQSEVKARIVAKYFDAWSGVMLGTAKRYSRDPKIAYIDLFCGPGRYTDGSKSTPIMILENALRNPTLRDSLVTLFNDKDPENVASLKVAISEIDNISSLKNQPTIYCSEVDSDAEKMFSSTKMCPTFSFVDPFGYKGLSAKFIRAMIKDWGSDSVFFFNYGRINAGISNPLVAKHMDALFGEERAEKMRDYVRNKSPAKREVYILEELANSLKDIGAPYVLPFKFKRVDGKRTSHALVFVSKHSLGYGIMKDIMARESSTEDEGVPSFQYSPADASTPLLFSLSRPLKQLSSDLCNTFAGKSLTFGEIFARHNVDTPYIQKNYRHALNKLETEGRITANPPMAKRQMRLGERTFAERTMVTFPPAKKS
ncbi:MAG: three-Cys-motif partner protein TcmP [Methylobacteriaceae bacterium]|nr:three-Cys-motif partner protein TcmP [Methylobacteriaceae bacterium]